jgi:tRNA pseudouridine55 synthase
MLGPGGILLIDKPAGVTSFQVVDLVRKRLLRAFPELKARARRSGRRGGPKPPRFRCGHAGTLDPLATGLLVLLVGKGSRLSPFLMGLDKTYTATVRFGIGTDTLDSEGETVATGPVPDDIGMMEGVLDGFRGDLQQIPPLISALKKDGQPLYRRVRSGEEVAEPEARPVHISRLELTGARWPETAADGTAVFEADLVVDCSSGTYIRSLARDLGRALGTEAHITALRRLRVGPFDVADALMGALDLDGEQLAAALWPLARALPQAPAVELSAAEAGQVRQGGQPLPTWLKRLDSAPVAVGKSGLLFRMLDEQGRLAAVGRVDEETGMPRIAAVIPAEAGPGASAEPGD